MGHVVMRERFPAQSHFPCVAAETQRHAGCVLAEFVKRLARGFFPECRDARIQRQGIAVHPSENRKHTAVHPLHVVKRIRLGSYGFDRCHRSQYVVDFPFRAFRHFKRHDRHGRITAMAEVRHVIPFVAHPCRELLVKRGQLPVAHRQREPLALAGSEKTRFGKRAQLRHRLGQSAFRCRHIQLHHFLAGHSPAVCHSDADFRSTATPAGTGIAVGERSVAQSVAERVCHLAAALVEIAVAHIYVFLIVGIVEIASRLLPYIRIITRRRHVGIGHGECHRQAARGVHIPAEHIGHGMSALLSRKPRHHDGVGQSAPRSRLDCTAHIHHHHYRLAFAVECLTHAFYHSLFGCREIEIIVDTTVGRLSRLAGKHHHGGFARLGLAVYEHSSSRQVRLGHHHAVVGHTLPLRAVGLRVEQQFLRLVVLFIISGGKRAYIITGLHKAVADVHNVLLVHIGRACPAGYRLIGRRPEQGYFRSAFQRKYVLVVFEQHHAFACNCARSRGMGL